jgi:hypothetical protein
MLFEAFTYLRTPCAPAFRKMGYGRELIALQARAKRCAAAWQPHLQRTRSMIEGVAEGAGPKGQAVVLGSGILADIPIEVLSQRFERVELVDLCHLPQTRARAKAFGNVTLRTADVNGLADALVAWVAKGAAPDALPSPQPMIGDILGAADLVVSANLLCQLPLLPLDYIQDKAPRVAEDALRTLAREIVERHIRLLSQAPGRICLISEVERLKGQGPEMSAAQSTLWDAAVTLPTDGVCDEEWLWDIAPAPVGSRSAPVQNRVRGLIAPDGQTLARRCLI